MTGSANIDHLEISDKVYIKSDAQVATADQGSRGQQVVVQRSVVDVTDRRRWPEQRDDAVSHQTP